MESIVEQKYKLLGSLLPLLNFMAPSKLSGRKAFMYIYLIHRKYMFRYLTVGVLYMIKTL